MFYIKLTAVQKKIYKFIKQKLNSLERAEAARKPPCGSPHSSTLPNVYKAGTLDERIWTSIFRCLGVSTDGKLHQAPEPREMLKSFWNILSPRSLKDEGKLKTLWFRVKNDSDTIEFSRGTNGWSEPDKKAPQKELQELETSPKTPPDKSSHGRTRDDFSEQAIYILDYPPKKLISSKKKTKQTEQKVKSFEFPPPVTRCRLSCPLPPTEFLPPERALYIPNFQPPNVKYAILQSVFLPHDKSSGEKPGGSGGSGMKTPENKSEKPSSSGGREVMKPPENELIKGNPLENVHKTNASGRKTEQNASQGSSRVADERKPTEEKGDTSVPPVSPVDSLDIPEFMPDNTRKRKNILTLKNTKSQNYSAPEDIPQMNALLFNPGEVKLQFTTVEAPTKIHKDEVLVKVFYAGVTNYDLLMVEGVIPCEQDSVIPGREVSGVVYAIGSDVDHVEPGDKIVVNAYAGCSACRNCSKGLYASCLNGWINNSLGVSKNGGWAEFVVVKKTEVHKVPEELGLDQAVLIMLLSCILSAQKKLNLSYDSSVIIQGLGVSGMLWASLLHSRGFRNVFVSDKNEKRRTQFDSLNLKYSFLTPDDIRKHSADVVVECTGASSSIEKALRILNPNGQICLFGKSSPTSEIRCLPFEIALREITIVGNGGNNLCFSEAIDLAAILSRTYLNLEKLGVQAFELNDFQRAFLMKKYEQIGKVVFTPQT